MRPLMERHSCACSVNESPEGTQAAIVGTSRAAHFKRVLVQPIGRGKGDNQHSPKKPHPPPFPFPLPFPTSPKSQGTGAMAGDSSKTGSDSRSSESSTPPADTPSTSAIDSTNTFSNAVTSSLADPITSTLPSLSSENPDSATSSGLLSIDSQSTVSTASSSSLSIIISESQTHTSLILPASPSPTESVAQSSMTLSSVSSFTPTSSTSEMHTSSINPSSMAAISKSSNHTGAIAGGVIGAFIFLCLLILGLCVFLKHRRRKRTPPSAEFREYAARYEAAAHGSNDDLSVPPPPFTRGNFNDPIIEKFETSQRANTPTYGYAV